MLDGPVRANQELPVTLIKCEPREKSISFISYRSLSNLVEETPRSISQLHRLTEYGIVFPRNTKWLVLKLLDNILR